MSVKTNKGNDIKKLTNICLKFYRVLITLCLLVLIPHSHVTAQVGNIPFDPLKILPQPKPLPESSGNSKKIEIIHADFLEQRTDTTTNVVKRILKDRVRLLHEGAIMKCDSAILYPQSNYLEAHGSIKITKGDSIDIRSKYLNYNGNTKLAILEQNVELRDQGSILKAPKMTYEVDNDIGHFWDGGQLFVDSTKLTSQNGTYYQHRGYTIFRNNVVLESPDYTIYADSMKYETETKVVHFITETIIVSNNDTIFTNDGYFDTEKNVAILKGRPLIKNGKDNTLQSNYIDYNKARGTGIATGNAISRNTKENVTLLSNHIHYIDSIQYTRATQDPLLIRYDKKDTLYVSADTLINYSIPLQDFLAQHQTNEAEENLLSTLFFISLFINANQDSTMSMYRDSVFLQSLKNRMAISDTNTHYHNESTTINTNTTGTDTLGNINKKSILADTTSTLPIEPNSVNNSPQIESDSVKIFYGYRNIKLIRSNMSGLCDSLYFNSKDSIFKLYYNPILWIDSMQMLADSIYILMKNEEAERVELYQNAIIINESDQGVFNQIAGKKITIWLKDDQVDLVVVNGNAESIYFLKNDSSQYIGGNRAIGATIYITFGDDNDIKEIKLNNTPEAKFTPIQLINFNSYKLPNFSWFWSYKPHTKWDVIRDTSQYNNYIKEYPHLPKDTVQNSERDSSATYIEDETYQIQELSLDNDTPIISDDSIKTQAPLNQGILNNRRSKSKKTE